ncbi:MAG: MBL fold metallo-hydrolase [Halobacteriaceae archaeon]
MELATGVEALEVTVDRGEQQMTFYPVVVETDRGTILVDVGLHGHVDAYRTALEDTGHDLEAVTAIVLTHQDGDHAGAIGPIADATDATVYAHRLATPFIDGERELAKGDGRYPPHPVDVQLVDDVRFRTWAGQMQVVFTPGHAPGHISLYFPDAELLLAADALTAPSGTLAGPNEQFTIDWSTAVDSIERLAELDVDRTHCYHGGPTDDGTDRLTELAATL